MSVGPSASRPVWSGCKFV